MMAKYKAELRTTLKAEGGWNNTVRSAHRPQTGCRARTLFCTKKKNGGGRQGNGDVHELHYDGHSSR